VNVITVKKSCIQYNTGSILTKYLAMGVYRSTLPHLIVNNLLLIYLTIRYTLIILHFEQFIILCLDVIFLTSTIIDLMKSAALMAFSFIIFLYALLVLFLSLSILLYVLYAFVYFCKFLFLWLNLCILISMYVLFCIFCFHLSN
jgi:hypothetical protein